jgi:nucleoid DNA-binding protein
MTKAELQSALAAATQTDKKTAGVFLDALSTIAYKAAKKDGEFVLPGFGKLAQALIPRRNRRSKFPQKP